MGKWCLHASLFIFDRIIIKVAGNQDRHKSSIKFDFGPNQTTHFGVTCPWVTKISRFRTWMSLKPAGQSWSNFMCSIIRVGERLHKVLGQIDLAHWTQVSDRCPLGYLFSIESSSKLLVTKTGIKARTSLISGQIRILTLELLALEWRKFYFRTWISLRPVGQSWSNFMCSITGGGERLHNVLRQIGS